MNAMESANTDRNLILPLLIDDPEKQNGSLKILKVVECDPSEIISKGALDSYATKLDNGNDLRNDENVDKFYDWLFEKAWAVQYYIEGETINLAIDKISREDALLQIHSEEEFRRLNIEIIQPSSGHFTECADHDRDENENTKKPAARESEIFQLVPGTRINAGLNSKALFSSFVGIVGGSSVAIPYYGCGLTVGHIFDEFSKDCSALSPEGETRIIAECFLRPEIPRMTTDISFIKFLEGVNFNEAACLRIRLSGSAHPKELSILSSELKNRLDDAKFLKMSVKRHRFTDKRLNKHHVLILDFVSNLDESTDKAYVCGAPVFDLSTFVEDELEMIGIVIGSYTEGDAGDNMVVANYLPEVLRQIQKNPTYMDQLFPDTEDGESRIEVSSTYRIAKS